MVTLDQLICVHDGSNGVYFCLNVCILIGLMNPMTAHAFSVSSCQLQFNNNLLSTNARILLCIKDILV
uniref:Uncharacterized protein n=1 Tax=Arundo donax TaxID=35708 RepID=A0A0A9C3L8_ARUDO